MPDDRNAREPSGYRAPFSSLRAVLIVESIAIIALVAGALWLVRDYRQGGQFIRDMLNVRYWLLVFVVSGLGAVAGLGPYYLGQRGTEEVFERFPQLEGDRWRLRLVIAPTRTRGSGSIFTTCRRTSSASAPSWRPS